MNVDQQSGENQMEESKREAEPVDRKQTVAFASGAVHLDPVETKLFQLLDRDICTREVCHHGGKSEDETESDSSCDGRVAVARLAEGRSCCAA